MAKNKSTCDLHHSIQEVHTKKILATQYNNFWHNMATQITKFETISLEIMGLNANRHCVPSAYTGEGK